MNDKWKMFKITLGELFLCEVVQYAGTIRYKKKPKKSKDCITEKNILRL